MPDTRFRVIVHTLEQTKAALRAAADSGCGIALQSAPDAIFYAGSLYLLEMFRKSKALYPQVDACFILDCADTGAQAIGAIRMGHTHLYSQAPKELYTKIADITGQCGVTMVRHAEETLDISHAADAYEACRAWLAEKVEIRIKND